MIDTNHGGHETHEGQQTVALVEGFSVDDQATVHFPGQENGASILTLSPRSEDAEDSDALDDNPTAQVVASAGWQVTLSLIYNPYKGSHA